jgi:hypothetical protein
LAELRPVPSRRDVYILCEGLRSFKMLASRADAIVGGCVAHSAITPARAIVTVSF